MFHILCLCFYAGKRISSCATIKIWTELVELAIIFHLWDKILSEHIRVLKRLDPCDFTCHVAFSAALSSPALTYCQVYWPWQPLGDATVALVLFSVFSFCTYTPSQHCASFSFILLIHSYSDSYHCMFLQFHYCNDPVYPQASFTSPPPLCCPTHMSCLCVLCVCVVVY